MIDVRTDLGDILGEQRVSVPAAVDETYMRRALELAWGAAGLTDPNPIVGAVVVAGGEVVGEGYHRACGGAHAEAVALEAAGARARGATLYVTLEPCAHHGRTPPCVDRILESGVARVVMTTLDPDRRVFGRGMGMLRDAGVRVDVGCLAPAAVAQGIGYYKNRLQAGAAVTLKMATTLDGKIASAPGRRDRITGPEALRTVHRMRAAHDCVVVGVDTVLVDAPALDCRLLPTEERDAVRAPVPVILDTTLRVPVENRWSVEERPYIVLAGPHAPRERERAIERGGGRVIRCEENPAGPGLTVASVLDALAGVGLERVLVEGGASVFTSFVRSGRWDALYLFQSRSLFGEGGVPLFRGERGGVIDGVHVDSIPVGDDVLHRFLSASARRNVLEPLEG